uniref:IS701 family transposase n=1 Tax=Microvirga calopogonii TaxID=2078013 RepID=UPI001FE16129
CHRTWRHAEILLVGAILAPGKRTVTSILRICGLSRERHFVNDHRVLSRARWSGREAARLLLGLLIQAFVPAGPVILGLDDTIERRRGKRIKAKGIYRDPVRSSDAHFVKASGLRWLSLMLLAPIPWAARTWALPFLTALAPSERYCRERRQRHKKLTDWARQMVLQVRRWLPERELVLVADMGFAALELLAALARRGVICITRLRLDAALYEPAPRRRPGTKGRPRSKGARLPNLSDVLKRTSTGWRRVTVPGWYGDGDRVIEFCSATAVWCHSGKPVVPIRWVLLRSARALLAPGVAVHRSEARPAADHPLVHPALAARGHLPGGARPSGRGDPAAMVGPCCRPHDALLVRPVLDHNPSGGPTRSAHPHGCLDRQLVPQVSSDVCGYSGCGAGEHLARNGFTHVPAPAQNAKTLTRASAMLAIRTLPCRLIGQTRAYIEQQNCSTVSQFNLWQRCSHVR